MYHEFICPAIKSDNENSINKWSFFKLNENERIEIVNSSHIKVIDDTLKFERLKAEDAGKYKCEFSNEFGKQSTIIEIKIGSKIISLINLILPIHILFMFNLSQNEAYLAFSRRYSPGHNHVCVCFHLGKKNRESRILSIRLNSFKF